MSSDLAVSNQSDRQTRTREKEERERRERSEVEKEKSKREESFLEHKGHVNDLGVADQLTVPKLIFIFFYSTKKQTTFYFMRSRMSLFGVKSAQFTKKANKLNFSVAPDSCSSVQRISGVTRHVQTWCLSSTAPLTWKKGGRTCFLSSAICCFFFCPIHQNNQ